MSKIMYTVAKYRAGASHVLSTEEVSNLRKARSIAWRIAQDLRPEGVTERPVWCGPSDWNSDDRLPGLIPVGGYAVGYEGSAAVVYKQAPAE